MAQPSGPDLAYRVIGRFVVEFSNFVHAMEGGLIHITAAGRGMEAITGWQAALTGVGARRMLDLFFAVATATCDLDDQEERIRDSLHGDSRQLIDTRNRVAHGTWLLASKTGDEPVRWDSPVLVYTGLSFKEGLRARSQRFTFNELESLSDEASRLRELMWTFASGCMQLGMQMPRVRDRLEISDGKVVRRDVSGWTPHS
jgi:hypothetical protein